MSRSKCDHCGHVWSTTATPNGTQGYWLSDLATEGLESVRERPDFDLGEYLHDHAPYVDRCPGCHQFSLVCEVDAREEDT